MTAVTPIRAHPYPAVVVLRDFQWMDLAGAEGVTAEVEYGLVNGQTMTVAAGGRTHSSPAAPPFVTYEVGLVHDPPRFWKRFTDDVGLIYACVPRLLISHYVVRSGGIRWSERHTSYPLKEA